MDIYSNLDLHFNNLENVGNWPQNLLSIQLLHADLNAVPKLIPTYTDENQSSEWDPEATYTWHDIEDQQKLTTDYAALCYAYKVGTEGNYSIMVEAVPIANYLSSALYGDGLQVDPNDGTVSVKIDPESDEYISVGEDGIKISGIAEAIEEAMEAANVTWDDVKIKETVKSYYEVGGIKGSLTNAATVVAGTEENPKTLHDLFNKMFSAEELAPTKTNPAFSSISVVTPDLSSYKHAGTALTSITVRPNVNNGSYSYGPAVQGVTWTFDLAEIQGVANAQSNIENGNIVINFKSGYKYIVGASSDFTVQLTGKHTGASNTAKTNLGNNYLDDQGNPVQIAADTTGQIKTVTFSFPNNYILKPVYFVFSTATNYLDVVQNLASAHAVWKDTYKTAYSGKEEGGYATFTYDFASDGQDYYLYVITNVDFKAEQFTASIMDSNPLNGQNPITLTGDNGVALSGYNVYRSDKKFNVINTHSVNFGFKL